MPIIEPEVTISIADKAEAEAILLRRDPQEPRRAARRPAGHAEADASRRRSNFYKPLVDHPKVMRVVALSGGYSRDEANAHARQEHRHHRQLLARPERGPSAQQTDAEFNAELEKTIQSIYDASVAG